MELHYVPPIRWRLGAALAAGALVWGAVVAGQDRPDGGGAPSDGPVYVIAVDTIIHPVAAEFVIDSLAQADREAALALVLKLDTPGGLVASAQDITRAMLSARTPVVVYVAPSGSRAASAGFFLLMAADVAAMAPGTRTGAAHPVGPQGEDVDGTLGKKVEQDLAAQIRSLAARNGRNVALAEEAVLESRSFTAEEALELGLVDLVTPTLTALLEEVEGRTVVKADRTEVTLRTATSQVREIEMTPVQRLRSVIVHPEVALLLLSLGSLGLLLELYNPGTILPGVVGGICVILGFYALSVLPVNYAGLALIILAILFFIAEIKVHSFGLLTLGGVVSLILGSLMLVKTTDPALKVSLQLVFGLSVVAVGLVAFLATMVLRAHRGKVQSGSAGLIHERGVARSAMDPRGKVSIHGEIWSAVAEGAVAKGEEVEVVAVEGMTLKVKPV